MKDTNLTTNNEIRNTDNETNTSVSVWVPFWPGATALVAIVNTVDAEAGLRKVFAVDCEGDIFEWYEVLVNGILLRSFAGPVIPERLRGLDADAREKIESVVQKCKAHYREMANYGMDNPDETE